MLGTAVWTLGLTGASFYAVGRRPDGPVDWILNVAFLGWLAGLMLTYIWSLLGDPDPWTVSAGPAAVGAAGITLGASLGVRRRRRTRPLTVKKALPWPELALITGLVFLGQEFLATFSVDFAASDVGRRIDTLPTFSRARAEAFATTWVLFFLLSQAITGLAFRSLAWALRFRWAVAEASRYRRDVLLAVAAVPVVAALVPSLMYGALVAGVLVRLGVLLAAFWLSRGYPRGRDADFLSWGPITLAHVLVRHRPHWVCDCTPLTTRLRGWLVRPFTRGQDRVEGGGGNAG